MYRVLNFVKVFTVMQRGPFIYIVYAGHLLEWRNSSMHRLQGCCNNYMLVCYLTKLVTIWTYTESNFLFRYSSSKQEIFMMATLHVAIV